AHSLDCAALCFAVWLNHFLIFFFSSRRRHTRCYRDRSSDVCSSDLPVRLYLPDGVTPFPTNLLPLLRAIRGEAVDAEEIIVRRRSEERRVGKECRGRGAREDEER